MALLVKQQQQKSKNKDVGQLEKSNVVQLISLCNFEVKVQPLFG